MTSNSQASSAMQSQKAVTAYFTIYHVLSSELSRPLFLQQIKLPANIAIIKLLHAPSVRFSENASGDHLVWNFNGVIWCFR